MSVLAGKNFMVYITGTGSIGDTDTSYPIGCDKTCTLNMQGDVLETTSKDNGPYRTFLPTTVSYQITGDGLVDYSKTMGVQSLQTLLNTRKLVSFKFESAEIDAQRIIYSGVGYFTQVQMSGPAEGAASFSYVIQVTGALSIDNTFTTTGTGGQSNDTVAQVYRLQFTTTAAQKTYQNDALVGASLIRFTIEDHELYEGTDSDDMTGLDTDTGTLTWNYEASNGERAIITYKK